MPMRFSRLVLMFSALILVFSVLPAFALDVPVQKRTQGDGFFRMMLGDFEVTAICDGYTEIPVKLLKWSKPKEIRDLLEWARVPTDRGVQTSVNAFLVHTGTHLVLVDTGAAKHIRPTMGDLLENIRAAGYEPSGVDTILLTHMHVDHVGGLTTADGAAAFPNAVVRVAKAESDYWLDAESERRVPENKKPAFRVAVQSVAPYAASGRLKPFEPGEELLPGVTAVPEPGHTPGQTGYLFSSKGQRLLAWGDIVHVRAAQFPKPGIAIDFDVDPKAAVATRKKIMAEAAREGYWVAGAHLPFPGIGTLRAEKKSYAWIPVQYGPVR